MKKQDSKSDINLNNTDCDISIGLTSEQVQERIDNGLINKIPKKVTKSYFKIFYDNVFNFFNLLLFAIFTFMLTAEFDPSQYVFIYLLLINIGIGLFQDIRARKQSDKLKVLSDPKIKVLRDGKEEVIQADKLVIDDIIFIQTGNQIITDSIVKEGTLEVNESLITGESNSIVKNPGDLLYSGSFVTSGFVKAQVKNVGKSNYAESLQLKAQKFKRPKSEILVSINKIFRIIAIVVLTLGVSMIVTFLVNKSFQNDYVGTVRSFAGSIVSMVPMGMFLLTSLTLAVGVIRLSKKRMLVQELYCIETLARVDTLCLDKTGTITDGNMNLKEIKTFSDISYSEIKNILFTLVSATNDQNPTANAILKSTTDSTLLSYSSFNAFNSKRKFSSVSLNDGRCFVLGAREFLPHNDSHIDEIAKNYEKEGLRVLLLSLSKQNILIDQKLPPLVPCALIVLEDHIKDDAIENINWFKNNGVNIKIISGDNPFSVSQIAKRVGVENAEKFISLEGMDIEKVKEIANEYTVFGRVSPEQKEAIVTSLQNQKHVVAMTGDGVNDILALRVADCSIAMASGSEAARAVSHLVSMDSNFSSLPNVVDEGRRVINNLQRTCSIFLIKTFFAMVLTFVFLIASWVNPEIKYPFITKNMYIWELLTIGFTSFFLSLQPSSERIKNTFFGNIVSKSIPGAIIQIICVLVLFLINTLAPDFIDYETTKTLAVITFTIISFYTLIIICRPFDKYRLVLTIAIGLLVVLFFIIDRFLLQESFFGLKYELINSSNWWLLLIILVLALPLYFLIDFLIKKLQNKLNIKEK